MPTKRVAFGLLLILNVLIIYSNHFRNDFQFDDINAIPNNPSIRSTSTILKAFVDPDLFSVSPEQRTYRPVTTASLALDYWLAGGLEVFFFHLSTFIWFSIQLALLFVLFERLMNFADPHPSNMWTALAAAAIFGFHPVNAETVNYIIQRADLYNALGCVASLWLFIRYPSQRKFGWYLLPVLLAILAKPPALIFPLLLLAYVLLFEAAELPPARKWKNALIAALPAIALCGAAAFLLQHMQVRTWNRGSVSPALYRLSQPYVALHYFQSFFLPNDLNIDQGWNYVSPFSVAACCGYGFIILLAVTALIAARRRSGAPIAFGMIWFIVTLLPTSLTALGDVTNDHRMFFPFVGLALAVMWSFRLALFRRTARLTRHHRLTQGAIAALAMVLILAGVATRGRNRVWLTKQALWRDSVTKNPHNARALTNYGAVSYAEADYETAFANWSRAAAIEPNNIRCQRDLLKAAVHVHQNDTADASFRRLLAIYPASSVVYAAYADWLGSIGRFDEGVSLLDRAHELDSNSDDVRSIRVRLIERRNAAGQIAVLNALDFDHDNRLSPAELVAAPAALASLDRNGDGKLSAEECGLKFVEGTHQSPEELHKARLRFMSSSPLLMALDANHDGEISASEIRNAVHGLERLDRDHNGSVEISELAPYYVVGVALGLMKKWRGDRGTREKSGLDDPSCRRLWAAADLDADGNVTFDELTNEVYYRADRDKDGIVTEAELDEAIRAGVLGPVTRRHFDQ